MSSQKYNFNGKVALVTGSSSGIGAAIAIQFAQYGASVTITGRDSVTLAEVGKKMKEISGKEPLQLVGDLLEPGFISKLVSKTVEEFGQLDFLINNAGGNTGFGHLKDAKLMEEFDRVMRLNVRSIVELTQLSIPHLEKTKGNVVNISSALSVRPNSNMMAYCTSKAALDMVTKCSAQELGPKGIRVNSINPGFVQSRFYRTLGLEKVDQSKYDAIAKATALGRIGQPEEIANLVSFVVSDDAANITGSILANDSGCLVK